MTTPSSGRRAGAKGDPRKLNFYVHKRHSKEERTFQAPFFTCLAMNTAQTLQITSMTAEKRNTFIQPI